MDGCYPQMGRDEIFEAAHVEEENMIHPHAVLTEEFEESREEKGSELGDGVQTTMEEAADIEMSDEKTEPQHESIPREGDEQDIDPAVGTQNEASSAREEEKGKGIENAPEHAPENASENVEEQGKKEKEEQGDVVRKAKKVKKSRNSSERIQRKLDKINAKIGRILAKKEDYERRLREALERERLESEKGDPLQSLRQREEPSASTEEPTALTEEPIASTEEPIASTEEPIALTEEPIALTEELTALTEEATASGSKDVDLVSEEINPPVNPANRLRQDDDFSSKQSNAKAAAEKGLSRPLSRSSSDKGPPRPISRTASLVEVTPEELMDEVAAQKRLVERLSKLQASDDGSQMKSFPSTDPSESILKDKGKGLAVDDSKSTETL